MQFTLERIMMRSKVFDPVTAVVGGSALLGLGGSIYGASKGADAAEEASENAADAQQASTAAQIASQEKMYEQGRTDFAPFRNVAPESLANLQSAVYGKPMTYVDANGVTQTAQGQQFDLQNFTPEGTAAYDWQKSRTLEDLGNYFNLTGRGRGSTVQSNATARSLGDLNAREYETGYNRLFTQKQDYVNNLLNLVKTAQGAAGSTGTLGQSAANQIGSAYQNQGNNLSQIELGNGQTQANLYSGIGGTAFNALGTGMQAYDLYSKYNQPATGYNTPNYVMASSGN